MNTTRPLNCFNAKSYLKCSFIMFNRQNPLQFTPFGDFRYEIRLLFMLTLYLSADLFSLRKDRILIFLINLCKKDSMLSKYINSCINFVMQLKKIRKNWKTGRPLFLSYMCCYCIRRKRRESPRLPNLIEMYHCAMKDFL